MGTGLTKSVVEGVIENEVRGISVSASRTGRFWGRVTIDGTIIEYRAYTLPNRTINIGTYYVPK
jgi:hypothetical protein